MTDTRCSFAKRAWEEPIEVSVIAGGQTTLNGKAPGISIDKLKPGRSSVDNSLTVHASVFDSPALQKFIDKMGGGDAIEQIYTEKHLDRDVDVSNDIDDTNNEYEPPTIVSRPFEFEPDSTPVESFNHTWPGDTETDSAPMVSKFRKLASDFPTDAVISTTNNPKLEERRAHRQEILSSVQYSPKTSLITTEDNHDCAECNKPVPPQAKFCPHCGVAQLVKFCMECSRQFQPKEKFCPDCGTRR